MRSRDLPGALIGVLAAARATLRRRPNRPFEEVSAGPQTAVAVRRSSLSRPPSDCHESACNRDFDPPDALSDRISPFRKRWRSRTNRSRDGGGVPAVELIFVSGSAFGVEKPVFGHF